MYTLYLVSPVQPDLESRTPLQLLLKKPKHLPSSYHAQQVVFESQPQDETKVYVFFAKWEGDYSLIGGNKDGELPSIRPLPSKILRFNLVVNAPLKPSQASEFYPQDSQELAASFSYLDLQQLINKLSNE